MSGRTFVLASSRDDAIAWCRKNGIKPYAKNTIIITTPLACRGHEYRDGDYAVNTGGCSAAVGDEWQNVIAAWAGDQVSDYW